LQRRSSDLESGTPKNLRERCAAIDNSGAPVLDLDALMIHGSQVVERQRQFAPHFAVDDKGKG
jgi:hypothetical protein